MATKRILCVDDNEDTRLMLRLLLEQAGYTVLTTGDVSDALSLIQSEHFDLYLLDDTLASGSGLDLCQQIRSFDSQTPIIFCSGHGREADRHEALDAGAQVYLVKPIDPDVLLAALASLFSAEAPGAG
jgi:DNA-binding response OmpR family regulator